MTAAEAPVMTLYHAPATAAMVVHWLLIELELPHRLAPLDLDKREQKSAAYLKLNPAGVVPTLVVGEQVLREAAAFAMHLGDLVPARALAPAVGTPARARYYQWMFFMANTLQPAYRAWFYPTEPAGEANVEAVKAQARARVETAWGQVAAHLEATGGPYMLGDALTVLDFMTTMLMRWSRNMPKPVDRWPVLHAYAQRMKARPSWQELYRREGLSEWA
ncbi:MAG TPA: glutathione S-transferase [Polyangia bacterium]|nr:glutathione S-transferase [Polyangia bacterium]